MNGKYLQIILVLFIPIILFLSTILHTGSNSEFFDNFFEENLDDYDLDNPELVSIGVAREVSHEVLGYLGDGGDLDEKLVGSRAKEHMKDVKNIKDVSNYTLLILIIILFIGLIIFISTKQTKRIPKILIWGSSLTLFLLALILLVSMIDFGWFWELIHKILFSNDLWILDPSTDKLVATFTLEFFTAFIKRIAYLTGITSLILLSIGLVWNFMVPKAKIEKHHIERDHNEYQWK